MKWYNRLYVGDSIKHKKEKIKWKIRHNAGQIDIYVITLASNPENLMDMIPAVELLQKGYPKKDIRVIGLAKGRAEAFEVITEIVEEVYLQTGDTKVREYISSHGIFGKTGE